MHGWPSQTQGESVNSRSHDIAWTFHFCISSSASLGTVLHPVNELIWDLVVNTCNFRRLCNYSDLLLRWHRSGAGPQPLHINSIKLNRMPVSFPFYLPVASQSVCRPKWDSEIRCVIKKHWHFLPVVITSLLFRFLLTHIYTPAQGLLRIFPYCCLPGGWDRRELSPSFLVTLLSGKWGTK